MGELGQYMSWGAASTGAASTGAVPMGTAASRSAVFVLGRFVG